MLTPLQDALVRSIWPADERAQVGALLTAWTLLVVAVGGGALLLGMRQPPPAAGSVTMADVHEARARWRTAG